MVPGRRRELGGKRHPNAETTNFRVASLELRGEVRAPNTNPHYLKPWPLGVEERAKE